MQANEQSATAVVSALTDLIRVGKREVVAGVDPGTAWFLARLKERPRRLTELASISRLDVSTISRHVASLEEKGLVVRESDPTDGRARVVTLTRQGSATLRKVRAHHVATMQQQLSLWPDDDVAALERLLTRLAAQMTQPDLTHDTKESA